MADSSLPVPHREGRKERLKRWYRRLHFFLFFKRRPAAGEYCNSKLIGEVECRGTPGKRPFLVVVRTGSRHCISGVHAGRNFDLALNHYAPPSTDLVFDYRYGGGLSKFMAARQFFGLTGMATYQGYMFMDDDLEISCDGLCAFLEHCLSRDTALAQPSLSPDSFFSIPDLLHQPSANDRETAMVEVMMPYMSAATLSSLLPTFDQSISSWGIDCVWPRLINSPPRVIDSFQVRHANPVGGGAFYRYLQSIGISPLEEMETLIRRYSQGIPAIPSGTVDSAVPGLGAIDGNSRYPSIVRRKT